MCKCGCFYRVENGKQIRHEMKDFNSKNIKANNFHEAEYHKQHLNEPSEKKHGDTRKKAKDKNMGLYSRKRLDKKNDK